MARRVTIPKALRIGVYPDVFERVLAVQGMRITLHLTQGDAHDEWADAEDGQSAEHERRKAENACTDLSVNVSSDDEQRRQARAEFDVRLYVQRYNDVHSANTASKPD